MWNDSSRRGLNQSLPTTTTMASSAAISLALAQQQHNRKEAFYTPVTVYAKTAATATATTATATFGTLNHGKDETIGFSVELTSTLTTALASRTAPTTVGAPPVWRHDSVWGHSTDRFMKEEDEANGSDNDEHVVALVPTTVVPHGRASVEWLEPLYSWTIHLHTTAAAATDMSSSATDWIRFLRNSEPNSAIYLARDEIWGAVEAICHAYPLVATFAIVHSTGTDADETSVHLMTDQNEVRAWLQRFIGPRTTTVLQSLETVLDEETTGMLDDSIHMEDLGFECLYRSNSGSGKLGHCSQRSLSLSDILERSNDDECFVDCELFPIATHRLPSFWCCGHSSGQSSSSSSLLVTSSSSSSSSSSSWSSNRMRTSAICVPSNTQWQESSWSCDDPIVTLTPCNSWSDSDDVLSISSSLDVVMGESDSSLE